MGELLKELSKYYGVLVLIGAIFGSYVAWKVDTEKIKFTQSAQAAQLEVAQEQVAYNTAQLYRMDKALILIEHDIPIMSKNLEEVKSDMKAIRNKIDKRS